MLALLSAAATYHAPALRLGAAARMATPYLRPYRVRPAMMGPASDTTANAATAALVEFPGMDSDRLRTVCVALLGQLAKVEEDIDELDFDGFSALIDEQKVQCGIEDKRSIFAMLDTDGGGTVRRARTRPAIANHQQPPNCDCVACAVPLRPKSMHATRP